MSIGLFTWIFGTGHTEIFWYGPRAKVSHVYMPDRPVISKCPNFQRSKPLYIPKVQYGPEIHVNRENFQFRLVIALEQLFPKFSDATRKIFF